MPVGGDVIQLVHVQQKNSQDILNVYHFEAVDGTATLEGLATWFSTNVVAAVKAVQLDTTFHIALELVNLYDKGEIYEVALSGTGGLATQDGIPTFLAASIRFLHSTAQLRSGWKRLLAGGESEKSGNEWGATIIGDLEDYAGLLVNPLTPTLATWAHVVVKRIKVLDMVTESFVYRLPENQEEGVLGYPVGYEVSPFITSQVSRKLWVGS
jgi:hypothetical protein